jgi:hypothetical protein
MTMAQHHQQCITSSEARYCIHVGGTVDGASLRDPVGYGNYGQCWENNLWTRMQNVGSEAIVNPWIHVQGWRRWHNVQQILDGIIEATMSDAEKARAIWEFARHHRYHSTTADDEVKDTAKMLNVYGYTLCWDEAFTLSNLWQAAGLQIRRGLPHGHCTTEVFFDGHWHLLDSDEHLLILDRDNETIVGETEISHDHDLMKRSHAYGVLSVEDRSRSEGAAALFCHDGARGGGRPVIGDHCMDLTLRPQEALTWAWAHRDRYHGHGDPPPRFCNGVLTWSPPLDESLPRWAESADEAHSDGTEVTADRLVWRLRAPYVMVGGRIRLNLGLTSARVELAREDGDWLQLASGLMGSTELDLDEFFPPASDPSYNVRLRVTGDRFTLRDLHIELTLQMAPLSLPELRLGDNEITYSDQTACESGGRHVELTHSWVERSDLTAPLAPELEGDGSQQVGTTPTLKWSDTCGPGGDYQVRLSSDLSMRWTLSPVFDKLISTTPSSGKACWTVPEVGLLNPETRYFWHVRARSAGGLWGPWSETSSFTCLAPGVPLGVKFEMDWDTRQGHLSWRANEQGQRPAKYEIYGCDERGFSVHQQEHFIVTGESDADGKRLMAANYMFTTESTHAVVVGNELPCGNYAFYRVAAVDTQGTRSGPSAFAEAPRPLVVTSLPESIPANSTTTVMLQSIQSIGDLRAESDGPQRYRMALRDGDDITFLLDEGPDFIELDPKSGTMTLRPESQHTSTHTVTLRVKNGQGGVDVVGFDLLVTP